MSIVGRREAAAGNQQVFHLLRDERTKRNPNALSIGKVSPLRIGTSMVVFDGRAAQSDLIVELARVQDILPGQTVLAMHSAGLPNSYLRSEGDEFRLRVSGYIALEEP